MSRTSDSAIDLGLMGGMFDPLHNGHLTIASTSLELLQLDALHFLPCGNPVHKNEDFASSAHRLAMLELGVKDIDSIQIDARECQSGAPSYTQNSLKSIRSESPGSRLFFILGQDAFNSLATWNRWEEIFLLAHIVIAGRPDSEIDLPPKLLSEFNNRLVNSVEEMKQYEHGKIFTANFPMIDISSTMVRKRINGGSDFQELVPSLVAQYIHTHNLYITEKSG
ncbi:MAG: nicotinate-nucleotide adenylyltransferase [Gammaproteobacteria bacterium]|nr:nicotinate-nucleotide adenylyltransferase [Gammaproteobacteria bacterium]